MIFETYRWYTEKEGNSSVLMAASKISKNMGRGKAKIRGGK